MIFGRGKGLHKPDPSKAVHRYGAELHPNIAAALAAGPVGHADLSGTIPVVFDQARCSGCWAHAAANLSAAARALAGKPLLKVPSPLYFMQAHYARMRLLANPTGGLPLLSDDGADLGEAAITFGQLGEIPIQGPQQGGNTDVPATTDDDGNPIPLPEPTVPEFTEGLSDTFGGEYAIPVDSNAPALLMATLDAGIYVWDGFQCDEACEDLAPNGILGAPGKSLGGHSTLYWGYDLNASRSYPVDGPVFFKRNSWGKSYCRNGDYTVGVEHVVNAWALWPFAIKVPS